MLLNMVNTISLVWFSCKYMPNNEKYIANTASDQSHQTSNCQKCTIFFYRLSLYALRRWKWPVVPCIVRSEIWNVVHKLVWLHERGLHLEILYALAVMSPNMPFMVAPNVYDQLFRLIYKGIHTINALINTRVSIRNLLSGEKGGRLLRPFFCWVSLWM